MATLRIIRRRITSVKGTQKVTRAMRMVAAAKLRRAQERILQARPYARKLAQVLSHVAALVDRNQHPLLAERPIKKVGLIVVTADRGLCGGFNTNIVRKALDTLRSYQDLECGVITVGRKGRDQFRRQEYHFFGEYVNFYRDLDFSNAQQIASTLKQLYLDHALDRVDVIYNEFKNAVQQNIVVEQLLPIKAEKVADTRSHVDFIYEPDIDSILESIIPLHLNIQIWRILLESNAAEQGARMTAMEAATDNAGEMIDRLTMLYNKTRQQNITRELSEIVGGAEALK